jgi:membrane-bound lytic murein transglycosylase B
MLESSRKLFASLAAVMITIGPAEAADPRFQNYVQKLWPAAKAGKISRATFDRAFLGVDSPDPAVLKLASNQPEFTSTTSQYLSKAVTPARIQAGQQKIVEKARLLAALERKYGVDRHVLVAIWGIESNFGTDKGSMGVMRSLATLAYDGRRRSYAQPQIVAALRILQSGVVSIDQLTGSWAGAMGHTQFIPTSYLAYAVDWTGDGARDLWNSEDDALASTANYLARSGWSSAHRWGWEVSLPANFDRSLIGRKRPRKVSAWKKLGVEPVAGGRFGGGDAESFIIIPQGIAGPAFLVTKNFLALMAYNESHSYAVAVGHLADRIRGQGPFLSPWPDQSMELTYAERVELQERLTARGFQTGGTDGRLGARTYEAILAFQKSRGMRLDGEPTRAVLVALRRSS